MTVCPDSQQLDGDCPIRVSLPSFEDLAQSAAAKKTDQLVGTDVLGHPWLVACTGSTLLQELIELSPKWRSPSALKHATGWRGMVIAGQESHHGV